MADRNQEALKKYRRSALRALIAELAGNLSDVAEVLAAAGMYFNPNAKNTFCAVVKVERDGETYVAHVHQMPMAAALSEGMRLRDNGRSDQTLDERFRKVDDDNDNDGSLFPDLTEALARMVSGKGPKKDDDEGDRGPQDPENARFA